MKSIVKFCLSLFLLILGVQTVYALNLPNYSDRVNDFAGIFSPEYKNQLENRLAKIETDTTNEVAVVSVNSLEGTTIEDYSEQLFQYWGIGKKGQDNGLLLLIAPNEREVRIEIGYGLEPIITDGQAGEIIRNQLAPNFKNSNYEQGVWLAMDKIEGYLRNDPNFKSEQLESSSNFFKTLLNNSNLFSRLFNILFFGFFLLPYLAAFFARSKSIYAGGVTGGLVGFYLGNSQSILMAIFLAFGVGVVGLLLDLILSRNYEKLKKLGRNTNFWSSRGGFWSGGSRHSGGGGGFGGFGGGSSGGGGASGKW